MAYYETVLMFRQELSTKQVTALTDKMIAIINEAGGNIARNEYWGLRQLAYQIENNRKAHYVLLNSDAPHTALDEVGRQCRLSEDILRYLTIKTDTLPTDASIMMSAKESKHSRSDNPSAPSA